MRTNATKELYSSKSKLIFLKLLRLLYEKLYFVNNGNQICTEVLGCKVVKGLGGTRCMLCSKSGCALFLYPEMRTLYFVLVAKHRDEKRVLLWVIICPQWFLGFQNTGKYNLDKNGVFYKISIKLTTNVSYVILKIFLFSWPRCIYRNICRH